MEKVRLCILSIALIIVMTFHYYEVKSVFRTIDEINKNYDVCELEIASINNKLDYLVR